MIWPLTLLPRFDGLPGPTNLRFDGLTILLTAASGGIGLEAAKSLAARGPSTLILTARDATKALATKTAIELYLAGLNLKAPPNVIVLALEMSEASSIHAFVRTLQSHTKHLDHAILNAGLIAPTHVPVKSTGYETSIQVNAISTIFLALQLFPLLLASPLTKQPEPCDRPHLTLVSSGTAWGANLNQPPSLSPTSETPLADLSQSSNFPPGTMGGVRTQYGRSKLILEHAFRHLAFLPQLDDPHSAGAAAPEPLVVVSSVCPGPTASNLASPFTEKSIVNTALVWVFKSLSRPSAVGANIYISSLGNGGEVRGEMWKDDRLLSGEIIKNVKGEEGKKVGDRVWSEMKHIMRKMDEGGDGVIAKMLG